MDIMSRLPKCAGQAAYAISLHIQVKMEDAPIIVQNFEVGMCKNFFYVYHNTNGQNLGPVWKTQSFLLIEICTVIHWQYCSGKGNLRKSFWNTVGRMFPILNACSYTVKKRFILICVCGWHQIGWRETKHLSGVEGTEQRSWFERTNIILWPWKPRMYSKTVWNKQRYCWQIQSHVPIQNFCRSNRKFTMLGKSVCLFMVLWHGRSCQGICVQRCCELASKTPQQ